MKTKHINRKQSLSKPWKGVDALLRTTDAFTVFRLLPLLLLAGLVMFSCEDEEISIPPASTQANFVYEIEMVPDEESGAIHYVVRFENTSIEAVAYHWDFGNGNTSTEENPVEVYTQDGVYEVVLTVEPRLDLHYNNLEKIERLALVSTIFREEFDDPALETDFPPEGWTLIDLDGDGHNWYWGSSMGEEEMEYYILSDSWVVGTGEVLEPDNWIITPQIDLTEISNVALEYQVTPRASGAAFRTEKYSVLVSTTGTAVDDFETIHTERLTEDMENWVWVLRTLDLSDYAGQEIHIAFRHHDSTDLWSIVMRDIHVYISGE